MQRAELRSGETELRRPRRMGRIAAAGGGPTLRLSRRRSQLGSVRWNQEAAAVRQQSVSYQRLTPTELQLERARMGSDPSEAQCERGQRRTEVRWRWVSEAAGCD
jgi:hypothetical protein